MTVYVDDASIAATVGPHTARWSHRVAEAVPAAGVQPTGQEPEHLHARQYSGRLQKTCHGCETVASRERGESGAWVTAYRPTLRAATAQRLRAAGIGAEDAGLQQSSITTPPSRRQRNHG